jgi:transposase-like protein
MGRRGYPTDFRRKVLDLVESGRPVVDVAKALGISDQMIYTWRRQDRIDRGLEPGLTSGERSELAAAKQRITTLEAELAVHRRAPGDVTPDLGHAEPRLGLEEARSSDGGEEDVP